MNRLIIKHYVELIQENMMDPWTPMSKEMDKEIVNGLMELFTKELGKMICVMAMDCMFHSMAQFMKVNGQEI